MVNAAILDNGDDNNDDAMAWYQLNEVRNLIKEIADGCDNLIAMLWFGHKAKNSLQDWAYETFYLLGHGENVRMRRVNPENALAMVDWIFANTTQEVEMDEAVEFTAKVNCEHIKNLDRAKDC